MADIRVFNKLSQAGLDILSKYHYTFNQSDQPDGILLRSQSLYELEFNENLLAIARAGAGVNNIPVDRCTENGIIVFNTPGANANAVRELVIAAMIVGARQILPAYDWVKSLTGEDMEIQVEAGKKQFKGSELRGKSIGVIGLGSIGHLVANACVDIGMTVYGYDPFMQKDAQDKLDYNINYVEDLESLYTQADFITLHVPALEANYHMINDDSLKLMKNDAILLNFSRPELVDENAVVKALDANLLRSYLTDFPSPQLIGRSDCLTFPHLGASTQEAETICAIMAAEQLIEFIEKGNIRNAVNFPNVEMPMDKETRLVIVNRNIPHMINLFVDEISKYQINIARFVNKSQHQYAYTMIDIEEDDPDILKQLKTNFALHEEVRSIRTITPQESTISN